MSTICKKTTDITYPHHWNCQFIDGHPDCECSQKKVCDAKECTIRDGSRRFPDGSHVLNDRNRVSCFVFAKYDLKDGSVSYT